MPIRSNTIHDLDNNDHCYPEVEVGALDDSDRRFLISFNRLEPDWSVYPYQDFPSVKWKMLNLEKFKRNRPNTYERHLSKLEMQLGV